MPVPEGRRWRCCADRLALRPPSETLAPRLGIGHPLRTTLCERLVVSDTLRLPLRRPLPSVFAQPRVRLPLVSAQPTVSRGLVSPSPPYLRSREEEVVVTLIPPGSRCGWPRRSPRWSSQPCRLAVSDELALIARRAGECETLSAAPVVCELPVDATTRHGLCPAIRPGRPSSRGGAGAAGHARHSPLTLAPTVLLCDWLAVGLAGSVRYALLCELPVELPVV